MKQLQRKSETRYEERFPMTSFAPSSNYAWCPLTPWRFSSIEWIPSYLKPISVVFLSLAIERALTSIMRMTLRTPFKWSHPWEAKSRRNKSNPFPTQDLHLHSDHSQLLVLSPSPPHNQRYFPSPACTSLQPPISQVLLLCQAILSSHPHLCPFPSESFLVPGATTLWGASLLLPFLAPGEHFSFLHPCQERRIRQKQHVASYWAFLGHKRKKVPRNIEYSFFFGGLVDSGSYKQV